MADLANARQSPPLALSSPVRLLPPASRFVLRGASPVMAAAGATLGLNISDIACRSAGNGRWAALWLGPDEQHRKALAGLLAQMDSATDDPDRFLDLDVAFHDLIMSAAASPLSRAIRQLENDLGALLLHRSPSGVTLTGAGTALYDEARTLLEQAERARARVVAAAGTATFTIGILADSAEEPGTSLAGAFRHRHPSVRVHVREADLSDSTMVQSRRGCRLRFP